MSTPTLLDAVRIVKENERLAQQVYGEASDKVPDKVGKRLFELLCEFEGAHYAQLAKLEKTLEESGEYKNYQGAAFPLPPTLKGDAARPFYQDSLMSAVTAAMDLESRAERVYAELATLTTHAQGRELFFHLSDQEHHHYLVLRDVYWGLNQ